MTTARPVPGAGAQLPRTAATGVPTATCRAGLRATLLAAVALAGLAACEKKEEILPGQRFDVRTPLAEAVPDETGSDARAAQAAAEAQAVPRAVPLRLSAPRRLTSWTHRGGDTDHRVPHLALSAAPEVAWTARIGAGNDRKHRITADPVIADGRIFALDSRATVSAVSAADGTVLWSRSLVPASDRSDDASGGGLALGAGLVVVATGFGEVTALDPATGEVAWVQDIEAPAAAAPLVSGGRVYVIGRDNRAWAIDAANGRVKWQQRSTAENAAVNGGASPADAGRVVLLPFSSGELAAVLPQSGIRIWQAAVSGSRPGAALSVIGDITADPVVDGARVYVGNQAGRLVALRRQNGERLWTANIGALNPVWSEGNSVFAISDDNRLVRLDARTGEVIWSRDLPGWKTRNTRKRREVYVNYGPILAGGQLMVASSDGKIRRFDPVTGTEAEPIKLPGGASSNMAVVDGTLYLITERGTLVALR